MGGGAHTVSAETELWGGREADAAREWQSVVVAKAERAAAVRSPACQNNLAGRRTEYVCMAWAMKHGKCSRRVTKEPQEWEGEMKERGEDEKGGLQAG